MKIKDETILTGSWNDTQSMTSMDDEESLTMLRKNVESMIVGKKEKGHRRNYRNNFCIKYQ